MRKLLAATAFATTALILSAATANAGNGHWYCTGDGIKSWSSDTSLKDATGWTYSGDRTTYKDGGACKHG